jgi:predicted DNA-binding protein
MAESTTVALPTQTKQRLDRLHGDLHITKGVPRWQTIERALQSLADQEDLDLEPDDSVDDDNGRRVKRGRGR